MRYILANFLVLGEKMFHNCLISYGSDIQLVSVPILMNPKCNVSCLIIAFLIERGCVYSDLNQRKFACNRGRSSFRNDRSKVYDNLVATLECVP